MSSVTISAAGCDCLASATLCPAHSDSASISPVVPTIGGAGEYRRIGSPEAKWAMTSPVSGSAAQWWAARGLPHLARLSCGSRGAERRAIRPSRGRGTSCCVGLGGVDQAAAVLVVDRHLVGEQEPGAQPGGLRAEREHGRDSSRVADPTGRDHRHRRDRVDYRRHQRERRHATPDVPAGLPALRDDHVDPSPDRAPRLLSTPDRVHHKPPGVVHHADIAVGVAQQKRHDPQTSSKGLIDSMVLIGAEHKIAGKRPVSQRCRVTHQSAASSAHHSDTLPSAPAFETAAGSRGSADNGASTIG